MIISTGTKIDVFPATTMISNQVTPTPGQQAWHRSSSLASSLLWTYGENISCFFKLPYGIDSVFEKIRIIWGCGDSAPTLTVKFQKKDWSIPELTITTIEEDSGNCPGERATIELDVDSYKILANNEYWVFVQVSNSIHEAVILYKIEFETSQRYL